MAIYDKSVRGSNDDAKEQEYPKKLINIVMVKLIIYRKNYR